MYPFFFLQINCLLFFQSNFNFNFKTQTNFEGIFKTVFHTFKITNELFLNPNKNCVSNLLGYPYTKSYIIGLFFGISLH